MLLQGSRIVEWLPDTPPPSSSEPSVFAFKLSFEFSEEIVTRPSVPQVFNRDMTQDIIALHLVRSNLLLLSFQVLNHCLQKSCAEFLLPILILEQEHISLPRLIKRPREVEYRVVCGQRIRCLLNGSNHLIFRHLPHIRLCSNMVVRGVWSGALLPLSC